MEDFKDRERRKFNEMTDKERLINMKPLNAYENMESNTNNKMLPGFSTVEEKDDYRRFHRKGISKIGGGGTGTFGNLNNNNNEKDGNNNEI